jgi:hypothetical protein
MDQYNSTYTGAILYSYPENILGDLATVKRAGGRVIIDIVGNNSHYKNSDGTFSLSKWKQRIDRMRGVNFSSYIADGTIIGEFIMDEPHNPDNWGGTLVSRATIDEMARYSKSIWPSLPVVIRSWADYLKGYSYKYLDAAWAQYSERKGPVATFIANNVADAKATGLALVVGMNVLDGGTSASGIPGYTSGKYAMSASQLKDWGSVLLGDSYACAFVSWRYSSSYVGRSDIRSALSSLSQKAGTRASRPCSLRGLSSPVPSESPDDPPPPPPPPPPPDDNSGPITLSVTGKIENGSRYMTLWWSGASGSTIDVYRDGAFHTNTENDGKYTNSLQIRVPSVTYVFKVCEKGTATCSATTSISF